MLSKEGLLKIGLTYEDRKQVVDGLSVLLANSYSLYLKTQNFHWNVTGPAFQTLHSMFEDQYKDLALAVDLIAERIRALGFPVHASFHEFAKLSSVVQVDGVPPSHEMIMQLLDGQQSVLSVCRKIYPDAERCHDQSTCELLAMRMQIHEKTSWMLRSFL